MAENFNTYIPPVPPLDSFNGYNLSENLGLGVTKMKMSSAAGNAKRAEMGLPGNKSGLIKYTTQRAEISYLKGRENMEAVKAAAVGVPPKARDYSSSLVFGLEAAELEKKDTGLSEEEIQELIRKRKISRETLKKWLQDRKEAAATGKEVTIEAKGSVEHATLSSMIMDDGQSASNKQERVAQTYSQPSLDSSIGDSGTANTDEPVLDSKA
ncbi:MAG: hypothetical protein CMI18_14105 [Opitutaceae bacterium]|nr:hypothetical protein [Opitutaceae bacterium]